jgi:hypothetical protein
MIITESGPFGKGHNANSYIRFRVAAPSPPPWNPEIEFCFRQSKIDVLSA